MPFVGINMAAPIESGAHSQIYLLPDSETIRADESNKTKVNLLLIKFFELLLTIVSILTFILSEDASISSTKDMVTCTILGMYLMYSLIVLVGPVEHNYNKLVFYNVIGFMALLTLGVVGAVSWSSMEFDIEKEYGTLPEDVLETAEFGANMKFASSVFTALNGVTYLIESTMMLLNIWGIKS